MKDWNCWFVVIAGRYVNYLASAGNKGWACEISSLIQTLKEMSKPYPEAIRNMRSQCPWKSLMDRCVGVWLTQQAREMCHINVLLRCRFCPWALQWSQLINHIHNTTWHITLKPCCQNVHREEGQYDLKWISYFMQRVDLKQISALTDEPYKTSQHTTKTF